MNFKEAYEILDLPQTATPEEAKKKYRELTKKLHPDINKEPDAEDKFKKINEAYQVVSSGKSTDREDARSSFWKNYSPVGVSQVFFSTPVTIKTTITFSESVLGCQKELKITRQIKCSNCNAAGHITLNNGCLSCGGRGQVVSRQGNMIFTHSCPKCGGHNQTEPCKSCFAKCILQVDSEIQVRIPGGVVDGNILTLRGMGNFVGSFGSIDQYSDALLTISIIPEPGLSLEGPDVVSSIKVSLQEALTGCKKIINTIEGYQDVDIKPMSRHKDEVIIPHLGVNKIGNQRVILDVQYPEDVSKIIDILNDSLNYKAN